MDLSQTLSEIGTNVELVTQAEQCCSFVAVRKAEELVAGDDAAAGEPKFSSRFSELVHDFHESAISEFPQAKILNNLLDDVKQYYTLVILPLGLIYHHR